MSRSPSQQAALPHLGPLAHLTSGRMTVERRRLHVLWRRGAGLALQVDRTGHAWPVTRDGLMRHIAATRFVHGDAEADRLTAELHSHLASQQRSLDAAGDGEQLVSSGRRRFRGWDRSRPPARARSASRGSSAAEDLRPSEDPEPAGQPTTAAERTGTDAVALRTGTTQGVAMSAKPGQWTSHGEQRVWANGWLDVAVANVTSPSGRHLEHDVLRARYAAAACLVTDAHDQVLLIWRHRFVSDRWGWELPSSAVHNGEDPLKAIVRDVEALCGWEVRGEHMVWTLSRCPEYTDQVGHLALARAREPVGPPNADHVADMRWFARAQLVHLLAGEVSDLSTVAALLWWLAWLDTGAERR